MQIFPRRRIFPICDQLPKFILFFVVSAASFISQNYAAAGNVLSQISSSATSPLYAVVSTTNIPTITTTTADAAEEASATWAAAVTQPSNDNDYNRRSSLSKWLLLPTTHQIELVPYLALPILAAQPTTPALSASSSTIPLKNHGRQLIPHDAIVAFSDNNNGKEFSSVGARGEGAGVGGGVIGGSSGGSKQYSGLPNRIEESSEKNKLKKYEGASTVSVADNEEILGGSLSDNMLEEFYRTPMSFGTDNLTMVTTQVGATAFLPCRIHYIGDGVVSWIRRKDYHLLTVALTTYSSDERFSVKHLKTSEDWALQMRYVQARDAGTYECQVSTHPPTSIFIHLNVIEARAEIIGPSLRYLTPDSTLRLICRVVQSTETVAFLFWYHDERMINYDTGINITTESDYHYSELTILRATKKHSGNYSCVPSNSQPASVLVHIFKGDNPAAMHHDHVNGASVRAPPHLFGNVSMAIVNAILVIAVLPLLFKSSSISSTSSDGGSVFLLRIR